MHPAPRRQQGMTLIVVLIMLVMITLFVITMVRLTSTTTTVVGNMQAQKVVETEAQQAVEIALNKFEFFNDALNNTNAWSNTATTRIDAATLWSTYAPSGAGATAPVTQSQIYVYRPQCIYAAPASGYSALSNVSPQDSTWDIKVTATDNFTGATTEVHQGVKMRLPAGSC